MRQTLLFLLVGIAFLWTGCSTTRSVPKNDKLYTGASVTVSGASSVRERKILRSDLSDLTRPKPNSKFLGIPFKLWWYNMFAKAKPKSFFGKIRDKMGQPPVLASQLDLPANIQILQNHLENKGYFRAKVTGDTVARRKKVHARYKADAGPQYKIDSVAFPNDTTIVSRTIQESVKYTLLKKGKSFDLDVIKGERTRIDAFLKERGFYFFSPDYLVVRTDTTIGNHLVNMYVAIKDSTPRQALEVYHINKVFVYANYSLNTASEDTMATHADLYNGYYIIQRHKQYKPRLLAEAMQFRRGDIYNRREHNFTLNRLINLDLFKFVKNRFEVVNSSDTAKLDAFYYLTPHPSQSLHAEISQVTRSNNLNGSNITVSWMHRNMFRNGSHIQLSAYVGSDIQFSGALRGYNTYRTGAEVSFAMPRFVIPFLYVQTYGGYAPRTNIKLGYDILKRQGLYTLNSYRIQYGYFWKENIQKQHELYPISISYVQPLNVTAAYDSLEKIYPGLDRSIEQQFILGSIYQFNYNQLANGLNPINAYYFNGVADVSGNIAGLIKGGNAKHGDTAKIANTPYSQYAKFEAEGRYYRKIGLKDNWASRIIIGIGLPYGNSVQLPYVKQFFVGGTNSLRGFRSRAVGPGTYIAQDSTIIPDQTGDIKFEVNTEYRPHISGPLYGAFFIDAGNIWLVNDSTYTHKPGAQFNGKWLSQLAVDVGAGLRFDITVFVIRFDVAFPLRKPWLQNPWVINQIKLGDTHWRKNNLVYNLAIGYPF